MPDQFEGFDNPKENWCKLPNVLIEALPLIETVSEFKVITYILRHTWGYREDEKRITLDEFANGRKRKDGSRIDNGTGLSIPSIRDGLKRAIEHGFVEHHQDDRDKARVKNFYSLKMRSGEKLLQSECKEDSPGDKDSLPRTEKETPETNTAKETKEGAAKKTPPAPSLREQAQAGEMTTETELDLLCGFGRQGKAGVADPSQDIAQYMQYTSDFLEMYRKRTGLHADSHVQKPAIQEIAAQPGADLDLWDKVITAWVKVGWNKRNVAGMIECYERGEIPSTNGGKANATPRRSNHSGSGLSGNRKRPAYSVADPSQFSKPGETT